MAALVISNTQATPFGAITISSVGALIRIIDQFERLQSVVANAESGFTGTAGTEFEGGLFGVQPNATPGQQGAAYAYAINVISQALATFNSSAAGALAQLDNGG